MRVRRKKGRGVRRTEARYLSTLTHVHPSGVINSSYTTSDRNSRRLEISLIQYLHAPVDCGLAATKIVLFHGSSHYYCDLRIEGKKLYVRVRRSGQK